MTECHAQRRRLRRVPFTLYSSHFALRKAARLRKILTHPNEAPSVRAPESLPAEVLT